MPKKATKNAFYYFMLDFKEQQRKKGINYANLAEVSVAADPEWRNAPTSVRTKYDNIAKEEKKRLNMSDQKFTSTGIPLSVIEQKEREIQEAAEYEKQDIKNMIKTKAFNQDQILDQDFYIMDVNPYCKTDVGYVIAESTVLRFNLRQGFRDFYHIKINPGPIPVGYASSVKEACELYGLEMPDQDLEMTNYMQILANIIDYLKQSKQNLKTLPPLYTMPEKVIPVQDFIVQMCLKAGEDESLFRVYRLDTMFCTLINTIKTAKNEGFPKDSLAASLLRRDLFEYTPGLGCEHHEAVDKSTSCTTSRTKRWAYMVMDSCCPVAGVDIKPGLHVPGDIDVNEVLAYKEQNKERAAPTVAGVCQAPSSCNSTFNDESFRDGASCAGAASASANTSAANTSAASDEPSKERRKYAPMRMPRSDYSSQIRPAPDLTEDNFPTLSSSGRGRGLRARFNNMNVKSDRQNPSDK